MQSIRENDGSRPERPKRAERFTEFAYFVRRNPDKGDVIAPHVYICICSVGALEVCDSLGKAFGSPKQSIGQQISQGQLLRCKRKITEYLICTSRREMQWGEGLELRNVVCADSEDQVYVLWVAGHVFAAHLISHLSLAGGSNRISRTLDFCSKILQLQHRLTFKAVRRNPCACCHCGLTETLHHGKKSLSIKVRLSFKVLTVGMHASMLAMQPQRGSVMTGTTFLYTWQPRAMYQAEPDTCMKIISEAGALWEHSRVLLISWSSFAFKLRGALIAELCGVCRCARGATWCVIVPCSARRKPGKNIKGIAGLELCQRV